MYADAIRFLGKPNYIRFLLNKDGSSMLMEPYHKKEFQSIRVHKDLDREPQKLQFRCRPLCRLMAYTLTWETEKSYRIPGRYVPAQGVVVFDMTKATVISLNSTS